VKNWLSIILEFLPAVLKTVIAVESAVVAPGATKKQIVLGVIQAGAGLAEDFPETKLQGVGALNDAVVGALNKAGVFQKTTAPEAPAV
jgi:hypothetical protein